MHSETSKKILSETSEETRQKVKEETNKNLSGITLLAPVPTGIRWKLKLFILTIFWLARDPSDRKTWKEFYYGLIDHEHEYDYDNLKRDGYGKYFECKHYGCNVVDAVDVVDVCDQNGNFL